MRRVAAAKWFGLVDRGRESSRPGAGATWPPVGGGPGHGSPGAAKAFHHECPSRVWRVIADDEKPGSIIDPGDGTAVCCRDYPTRPPRRPSRSRTGRRTLVAAEPRWWLQCMSALLSRPWPGRDAVATDASRVAARCGSPTFVPVEAAVVNRLAGPEPSRPTKRSLERMLWKSAVEEVGEPGGSGPCAAPDLAQRLFSPVPDEPRGDRDAPPRPRPDRSGAPGHTLRKRSYRVRVRGARRCRIRRPQRAVALPEGPDRDIRLLRLARLHVTQPNSLPTRSEVDDRMDEHRFDALAR